MSDKVKIADPKDAKPGWSTWIENGTWYTATTVDRKKFGGHDYDGGGFERGVRECKCGAHMSGCSSSGPVDPFGPCPKNPKPLAMAGKPRPRPETKLNWMETRTQEVSQYHCTKCTEIFQFASDKHGTERPPVNCPMCGRPA